MKKTEKIEPALYGISHSNRNFNDKYYWGKNQFNSSFPASLACYMRDRCYGCILISQDGERTVVSEAAIDDIFGTTLCNERLRFNFESAYTPYKKFVEDEMSIIDLVITENDTGKFIRPLEIKLTTLPDSETFKLSENRYGSEIVVRSPTMRYMALGIAEKCKENDRRKIAKIFRQACLGIHDWENAVEMCARREKILSAMDTFFIEFEKYQQPLVMQPVWKTVAMEPLLADNCLDIFAWTDIGLGRFILRLAQANNGDKITRHQRSILRLARFLWEFAATGWVWQGPIYDGMNYNTKNDKEFSIGGRQTNEIMRCARLTKPIVQKKEIKNIVLGGGQKYLSPERRFDAILFFSTDLFED